MLVLIHLSILHKQSHLNIHQIHQSYVLIIINSSNSYWYVQVLVVIFICGILAPSSPVLSGLVINVAHAEETDPLKIQNLPIGTGEFTSTTLPLLSVLQSGVLGNLTKDVLERLKDFLDSRPIASFDRI